MEKALKTHRFIFDDYDNGGEQLILTTYFLGNGDPITATEGIFTNQKLTLNSYCNKASIELYGIALTPDNLRKLADELEKAEKEVRE